MAHLLTLPETLPVEAINDWGIGVGLPIILAENATLPDGIVSGMILNAWSLGSHRDMPLSGAKRMWMQIVRRGAGYSRRVTVVLGVWNRTKASTGMNQWIVLILSISRDSMTITTSVIGASNPWYSAGTTV